MTKKNDMKTYFKVPASYFLLTLLSVSILIAQPRKINDVISLKASSKLHYQLQLGAIYQKDYENNQLNNTTALPQYKQRISSMSKSIKVNTDENEPSLNVLIRLKKDTYLSPIYYRDATIINGGGVTFITATVYIKDLETICLFDNVIAIEPSFITEPLLDNSTKDIHADQVWSGNLGNEISNKITGENVYIGIIDKKPNTNHITFLDANQMSRFKEIAPFDSYSNTGNHGTVVAGIAAGSGDQSGNYKGVAFKSTLLWFPTKQNNLTNESNTILNAIDRMKKEAGEKPLIINNSNGIFFGPRDGTLEIENAIDSLMQGNKIFVNAAGNQSNRNNSIYIPFIIDKTYPMHFQGFVTNNTEEYVEIKYHVRFGVDNNNSTIEIWHENDIDVEIVDNDLILPDVSQRVGPGKFVTAWNFDSNSDDFITIINSSNNDNGFTEPNSSKSKVLSIMFKSGDSSFSSGDYKIRIYPHTNVDSGIINAYICYNGTNISGFINGDDYQTVVSPGLAKNVICVGNHKKNIDGGDISGSSSLGPLRTDINAQISKPDISAPGECIISASNEDNSSFTNNLCDNSGTSFSAPHVTGAIALLMQCFPQLTAVQVKEILQKSAGPIPNGTLTLEDRKYWGAGKMDILTAYKSMVGFSYERPYAYDENKYNSTYLANPGSGLPFGPVNYNWTNINFSYQKYTNGAIFSDNRETNAYWLGEGIWKKWIALDSVNSQIGLPVSSEYIDASNNNYSTVKFQKGNIYWNGTEAIVNLSLLQPPAQAGNISGLSNVIKGQNNVQYSVNPIANASGYVWSLPTGVTIVSGNNSNNITVNFSASAVSGNFSVYGTNSIGNGNPSPNFAVTVNNPTGASSISGKVFNDLNNNGVFEVGIDSPQSSGWTVQISGPVNLATTTTADGMYSFTNLPAGTYSISEIVPPDWTVLSPYWSSAYKINLVTNKNEINKDFANFYQIRNNSDIEYLIFPNGQKTGQNDVVPMSPFAPQQSDPISIDDLPINTIHLDISSAGFASNVFYVKPNAIVQLAISSIDEFTHVFMFEDSKLEAVAIGVGPNETRLITFKTYNLVDGEILKFKCDVPGHEARGEIGQMIVSNNLTSTSSISNSNFKLFPNPCTESFKVMGFSEQALLKVIDIQGKVQFEKSVVEYETIHLNTLPRGLYLIQLITHDKVYESKLIK